MSEELEKQAKTAAWISNNHNLTEKDVRIWLWVPLEVAEKQLAEKDKEIEFWHSSRWTRRKRKEYLDGGLQYART